MTGEITGRTVLWIALGAFGVVIAANLALAYAAIGSFPGIEVRNGYVASQTFEAERAAQVRLGWEARAAYSDGILDVSVQTSTGDPAAIRALELRIGRPATETDDRRATLTRDGDGYRLPISLEPGFWRLDISSLPEAGAPFRQMLTIEVVP